MATKRLLVVDDEVAFLIALRKLLTEPGIEVDTAETMEDSMDLLARAVKILQERDFRICNVDVTVICERPKIAPYADSMRRRLSRALGLSPGAVSIKGKTDEGMGWTGSGQGLAVHAVALIEGDGDGILSGDRSRPF